MKESVRIGASLRLAVVCAAVVLGTRGQDLGAQCAMCSTALGGPEDPTRTALLWSVLLLLAVPFSLVGSVAAWLVVAHRRARGPERSRLLRFRREGIDPAPPGTKEDTRWIER